MMFNEFNKRLEKCHLDQDTKYLLTHMFEVQVEMNKQLDSCTNMILALTAAVQRFTELHEATRRKVMELGQYGKTPGVEVHSVRRDPDDD